MKVADLKKLPKATRERVPDAEEGMVDALLNILRCQTSGENCFGDVVYGTKPSNRFVSGFLLPRFDPWPMTRPLTSGSARSCWTSRWPRPRRASSW